MPTPKSKLSKFILSLPATLTGTQVVERAKAKGMKTSGANVYRVRGLYGANAAKPAAKTPGAPTSSKLEPTSKSEFIRQVPASMSAKDVVARGKAAGLAFDKDYVYKVRRTAKEKAGAPLVKVASPASNAKAKARATPGKEGVALRPLSATSSAEGLLRALAAELGLGRAVEILRGERARVQSILSR